MTLWQSWTYYDNRVWLQFYCNAHWKENWISQCIAQNFSTADVVHLQTFKICDQRCLKLGRTSATLKDICNFERHLQLWKTSANWSCLNFPKWLFSTMNKSVSLKRTKLIPECQWWASTRVPIQHGQPKTSRHMPEIKKGNVQKHGRVGMVSVAIAMRCHNGWDGRDKGRLLSNSNEAFVWNWCFPTLSPVMTRPTGHQGKTPPAVLGAGDLSRQGESCAIPPIKRSQNLQESMVYRFSGRFPL